MTCIVGYAVDGKVYMGGDAAAVAGHITLPRKDPKVFKNGEFIMGFTDSFRMGDLLEYKLEIPDASFHDREFMCTVFVDAVRKCLKEGGYTTIANNEEEGGTFLVGVGKTLYTVDSDFQVGEHICPYSSIGCGEDFAMGSMFASTLLNSKLAKAKQLNPKDQIHMALEAASEFSGWVNGPHTIINT